MAENEKATSKKEAKLTPAQARRATIPNLATYKNVESVKAQMRDVYRMNVSDAFARDLMKFVKDMTKMAGDAK
jgi:hypothetical protein